MTKRNGSYRAISGKKPRLEDEDLWEDDLDPEALEKCFEQATQNDVPSQSHDSSVSSTYNEFKIPGAFLASTQVHNVPSTSNKWSLKELEVEVKNLKQKNEEKEGEILILRSRIRETASTIKAEHQRTTNDWRQKFYSAQKEVKSITSDLEFKNLEIANLRQQLAEIRRINVETFNSSQVPPPVAVKPLNCSSKPEESYQNSHRAVYKEPIVEQIYPLKSLPVDAITGTCCEIHTITEVCHRSSLNTIPYLQRQPNFNHLCSPMDNNNITTEHLYPDVFKLVNSNLEHLNSPDCLEATQKVFCVTLILLKDLSEFVAEYGLHMKTEDIQQLDAVSLLSIESSRKGYLGSQASKTLTIMAHLMLYCPLVCDFVCKNSPLQLLESLKDFAQMIPHRNCTVLNDYYVLRLLLSLTSNIGKYRLAHQATDFLMSTLNFLESIARLDNEPDSTANNQCMELFCKIFKQIIFARPKPEVIKRIMFLLKICSRYKIVVQYLFRKNASNEMLKATSRGVLYFTESAFLSGCGCLSLFYKLEIDFVFRTLENLKSLDEDENSQIEWRKFLNHDIIQKVLYQMKFNNFELSEKYVLVFTRYKEIEKILKTEGTFEVSELHQTEELPNVSDKDFNKDF
ncbi:hypothetical protein HUJ04_009107 [Dendroctonus ponderosae]|nr:hypothetical protein HUJ04_009107 [Dendroctonus ponderosae]